jgi:hypothetical protein
MRHLIDNQNKIFSETEKLCLIIRHSERNHIPKGKHDIETLLNEKGIQRAKEFGEILKPFENIKIISSPVERCRETAKYILEGFGCREKEILLSNVLGEPGPYVYDGKVAVHYFINQSVYEVVKRQQNGEILNGIYPIEKGSKILFNFVVNEFQKIENKTILVLVTHDAIVAPFVNFYFNEWFDEKNWVDFLDGVFITKKSNQTIMNRNTLQYEIH